MLTLKKLSVEPNTPELAKVFKFWLRTVEDFISGLDKARAEDQLAINREHINISCLSVEIFPYVEDCQNYNKIVATLCQIFVKQKNNAYARHRLVNRHQDPGESIADFLLALKQLAKDCTFSVVTANEY